MNTKLNVRLETEETRDIETAVSLLLESWSFKVHNLNRSAALRALLYFGVDAVAKGSELRFKELSKEGQRVRAPDWLISLVDALAQKEGRGRTALAASLISLGAQKVLESHVTR